MLQILRLSLLMIVVSVVVGWLRWLLCHRSTIANRCCFVASLLRCHFASFLCDLRCRCVTFRFGSLFRFDSIRFGSVRFALVRFGSLRFASVRFGSLRFASVRFDSLVLLLVSWWLWSLSSLSSPLLLSSLRCRRR